MLFVARTFGLAVLIGTCFAAARAQDVETIVRSHLERTLSFSGIVFEYESSHSVGEAAPVVLQNKLALFSPLDLDSRQVRRLWIATRENPGEPWEPVPRTLAHCFKGFDGREYRSFSRSYSTQETTRLFHPSSVNTFDLRDYHSNQFEEFLTGGPHLVPQYGDPWGKFIDTHPVRFTVADRAIREGRKTVQLEWLDAPEGDSYTVILLDGDGFLPMEIRIQHDHREGVVLETTAVGSYEGLVYPAAGSFRTAGFGDDPEEEYSFTVTAVSRTNPESVYWPEWPVGTIASNSAGKSVVSIPYPPDIRADAVKRYTLDQNNTYSIWFWLTAFLVMVGVGTVLLKRLRR